MANAASDSTGTPAYCRAGKHPTAFLLADGAQCTPCLDTGTTGGISGAPIELTAGIAEKSEAAAQMAVSYPAECDALNRRGAVAAPG